MMPEMKCQARPPKTQPLTREAFMPFNETAVYWLGMAGVLVNSRGTLLMMDPVISIHEDDPSRSEMEGKPLLAPPPILASQVNKLDAVLYTHADGDHLAPKSALALLATGAIYHATLHTANVLQGMGIPEDRIHAHPQGHAFAVGNIRVEMTRAFHPWQIGLPEARLRRYTLDDCCGYRLVMEDGILWNPGDTMLMEEHFSNTDADAVLMDFSDNEHHFGRKIAIQLANVLRTSDLLMIHWGTVYMPEHGCFNADPAQARPGIMEPNRLRVLAPGEKYVLSRKKLRNQF